MQSLNEIFFELFSETAFTLRSKFDQRLKPLGLSQAKWRALLHLSLAEKPLTQTELANRMRIEGPTLVGLLDRLEKSGWIKRQLITNDRRCNNAILTEKAKKTLESIHLIANELRKELLLVFTKKELTTFTNLLQKIKNHAEDLK